MSAGRPEKERFGSKVPAEKRLPPFKPPPPPPRTNPPAAHGLRPALPDFHARSPPTAAPKDLAWPALEAEAAHAVVRPSFPQPPRPPADGSEHPEVAAQAPHQPSLPPPPDAPVEASRSRSSSHSPTKKRPPPPPPPPPPGGVRLHTHGGSGWTKKGSSPQAPRAHAAAQAGDRSQPRVRHAPMLPIVDVPASAAQLDGTPTPTAGDRQGRSLRLSASNRSPLPPPPALPCPPTVSSAVSSGSASPSGPVTGASAAPVFPTAAAVAAAPTSRGGSRSPSPRHAPGSANRPGRQALRQAGLAGSSDPRRGAGQPEVPDENLEEEDV